MTIIVRLPIKNQRDIKKKEKTAWKLKQRGGEERKNSQKLKGLLLCKLWDMWSPLLIEGILCNRKQQDLAREGVTDSVKWNLGEEKPTWSSQTKLGAHETDGNLGCMIHGQKMPEEIHTKLQNN